MIRSGVPSVSENPWYHSILSRGDFYAMNVSAQCLQWVWSKVYQTVPTPSTSGKLVDYYEKSQQQKPLNPSRSKG